MDNKLPNWLVVKSDDLPTIKKAKLGIISLNLKVIKSLLNQLTRPKELAKSKSTPIISLLVYVINLILILCSYKLIFLWLMALYLLIKLVTFPAKLMIQTLKKLGQLLLMSLILIGPSIFMGHHNVGLFLIRIGLVMMQTSIYLNSTNWQDFFIALRQLRVPTVIVTTLDIMIKYTYTLGSYLLEVLNSIQLRSIGQPVDRKMVGNIIGKLYLSAKQRSVEVYQAMLMRGYYQPALVRQKYKFNRYDGWELLQLVVVIMVFIFSRG